MFRVLDTDKDDMVNFREVMIGFHNLSTAGDEKEKLRMVFEVSFHLSWMYSFSWESSHSWLFPDVRCGWYEDNQSWKYEDVSYQRSSFSRGLFYIIFVFGMSVIHHLELEKQVWERGLVIRVKFYYSIPGYLSFEKKPDVTYPVSRGQIFGFLFNKWMELRNQAKIWFKCWHFNLIFVCPQKLVNTWWAFLCLNIFNSTLKELFCQIDISSLKENFIFS